MQKEVQAYTSTDRKKKIEIDGSIEHIQNWIEECAEKEKERRTHARAHIHRTSRIIIIKVEEVTWTKTVNTAHENDAIYIKRIICDFIWINLLHYLLLLLLLFWGFGIFLTKCIAKHKVHSHYHVWYQWPFKRLLGTEQ